MHDSMINDHLLIISIFNLLQEEMKSSHQNFSQKFLSLDRHLSAIKQLLSQIN